MTAFYNEIDPYAAAWLRNLIAAGHIAPGVVDERSIEDINPEELLGYTQCHFFAGVGVWSYALRCAGWPDDQPVWTGSCPCQPFSAAGKGAGADDLRHLWPAWHHLIAAVQPPVVFGEQVEAAIRHGWLDLVQADLEGIGYAFGAAGLPAAGVGAPHIRQRLWFVAESEGFGRERQQDQRPAGILGQAFCASELRLESGTHSAASGLLAQPTQQQQHGARSGGAAGRPEHPDGGATRSVAHHHHHQGLEGRERAGERTGIQCPAVERSGEVGRVAHDSQGGFGIDRSASRSSGHVALGQPVGVLGEPDGTGSQPGGAATEAARYGGSTFPASGLGDHWSSCDWIPCRDGKWRPVEPGTFPLAHGAPSRVGRLRAYGNAIVAPCAEAFIRSAVEAFELKDMLS